MFYVIVNGNIIREIPQHNVEYFKRQDNGINILSDSSDYNYIYSRDTDTSYDRSTHMVYEFESVPESDNIARDYIIVNGEFHESDYLVLSKKFDEISQGGSEEIYGDIANAIKMGADLI